MDVLPGLVVLRLTDRVVLDHPSPMGVPLPLSAATLDPDSIDPSGWRRSMCPTVSGGRGWTPDVLHFGDVVEFGSYSDLRWRWFAGTRITPATRLSRHAHSHLRMTRGWMGNLRAARSLIGAARLSAIAPPCGGRRGVGNTAPGPLEGRSRHPPDRAPSPGSTATMAGPTIVTAPLARLLLREAMATSRPLPSHPSNRDVGSATTRQHSRR
jgi:hypothetical protein